MDDEESVTQASVTMDIKGLAAKKDGKSGIVASDDSHLSTEMAETSTMTPQRITPEQSLAVSNDTSRHSEEGSDTYGEAAKPKRTPLSLFSEGNDDENDPKSNDASTSTLSLSKHEHESIKRKRPRHYVADDIFVTHGKMSNVNVALQFTQDSFETAEPGEHHLSQQLSEESMEPALFSQATLPIDYTPMSQTREENIETFFLMDCVSKKTRPLIHGLEVIVSRKDSQDVEVDVDKYTEFTIGRDRASNLIVLTHASIGNRHAKLVYNCTTHAWTLQAIHNTCWILRIETGKWMGVIAGSQAEPLPIHGTFRLVAPSLSEGKHMQNVQFTLSRCLRAGNPLGARAAGSLSLDEAYLELLRKIETFGHMQTNRKGPSKTLRDPHTLLIDLHSDDFETNLLPITTLRKLHGGQMAIYEALWYIRGENHIDFLQKHNCKVRIFVMNEITLCSLVLDITLTHSVLKQFSILVSSGMRKRNAEVLSASATVC
jgi:hypothetical protein